MTRKRIRLRESPKFRPALVVDPQLARVTYLPSLAVVSGGCERMREDTRG